MYKMVVNRGTFGFEVVPRSLKRYECNFTKGKNITRIQMEKTYQHLRTF